MSTQTAISLKRRTIATFSLATVILLSGLSTRADGATTSYTYDSLYRLATADYGNGLVINYTYDAAGNRLSQAVTSIVPTIATQPAATQATILNGTATFTVAANGTGPFTYQWKLNGTNLVNGGDVSGANAATLTLANVGAAQAGSYTVTVSNVNTSATSAAGILTVLSPNQYAVTTSALPNVGGTASGGGSVANGTPVTLTATANSSYTFSNWTENGTVVSTAASFPFTVNGNRTLVANFTAGSSTARTFDWAKKAGGASDEQFGGLATDAAGNSYVTGYFQGTATFGAVTLTSAGAHDIFLAKYNAAGNVEWAKRFGGSDVDVGEGVGVDSAGNIYVSGYFRGTSAFGAFQLTGTGGRDAFLAKCDATGNVLWVRRAGGADAVADKVYVFDLAVSSSGESFVGGYFLGSATFGTTQLTSAGDRDIFVAKYDSIGNLAWVRRAGGTSGDYFHAIAIDAVGNSYITGRFQGSAVFGATTLTATTSNAMFVAKLDAAGNTVWAKSAGGADGGAGNGIAVDATGNLVVVGDFTGTAVFAAKTLTTSNQDCFVVKYDPAGNVLWSAQAEAGMSVENFAFGEGVAADTAGNICVTGTYGGTATFGNIVLSSNDSINNGFDVFTTKYDGAGNVLWAKRYGGSNVHGLPGVALDAPGNIYVAGNLQSTASFDSVALASAGGTDVFVAKLSSASASTYYATWAAAHGLTGVRSGMGDNFDSDGLNNFEEMAFGTDPTLANGGVITLNGLSISQHGKPTTWLQNTANGVDYRVLFGRRKDYGAAGLTYTVQFSADLVTWQTSAEIPTVVASDAEIEAVTVPFPVPMNGRKTRSFRVLVSSP